MATIFDKARFMEMYVINYVTHTQVTKPYYPQRDITPTEHTVHIIERALSLAELAWDALEVVKQTKSNLDVHQPLRFMFEPADTMYGR